MPPSGGDGPSARRQMGQEAEAAQDLELLADFVFHMPVVRMRGQYKFDICLSA